MSEKFKENMSALIDGELELRSATETIDVLLESDTLKVQWSRYHVVRDVLRHKAYPEAGGEFRDRVRNCLADEPLHFPRERQTSQRWRGALKPVAGLALAASVAVVAVLAVRGGPGSLPGEISVPPVSQVEQATTSASLAGARTTPATSAAPRLTAAGIPAQRLRRLQWDTSELAVANRLNGYLVNHSEYLGDAMKGMHPYARIVGYDSTGQR